MQKIDCPVQFEIKLPQALADDMQALEEETGFSKAEIFRRSISLYKRLKKAEREDASVILMEKNGTLKELIGF